MKTPEDNEMTDIIRAEAGDELLRGFFRAASGQVYFDRRYTIASVLGGQGIGPRTIDLNLSGLDIVPVSDELAAELGYNGGQDGTIDPTL